MLLWASSARAAGAREQEAFADQAIDLMKTGERAVRERLGTAQASRNAVWARCLDDKLTQLETVQRQAEDARGALRRASLREDVDAIQQAAGSMTRLDARAKELRTEADACVGRDVVMLAGMRDARGPARGELDQTIVSGQIAAEKSRADGGEEAVGFFSAPASTPASGAAPVASAAPAAPAAPAASAGFAPTPAPSGSPYAGDVTHEASRLAYSADLALAVFQVDASLASVEAVARELGGYLAQRGDAQVTVRVPRPRFDEALARVEKLGDVVHRNVAAEDVTDEYVDLDLRLKNARAMRDQLAGLLKGAAVKDAVEIEKELAKVTEVIEQIEGRLKVLRDKVGYSSITVSFQANAPSPVRSTAILPFPWLDSMGLQALLDVPKVTP
jgi:hypothetical protein